MLTSDLRDLPFRSQRQRKKTAHRNLDPSSKSTGQMGKACEEIPKTNNHGNQEGYRNPASSNQEQSWKPWNELFRNNIEGPSRVSRRSVEILESISSRCCDRVIFDEDSLNRWREPWKSSLIGKFLTKSPPTHLLKLATAKIWNSKAPNAIIDLPNGYYIFRFSSQEEAIEVLTGGPWTILGEALNLIPWKPNFLPLLHKLTTAPIWIRLPGLPLEYRNPDSIMAIAAKIGKPLKLDDIATLYNAGKFPRVCVVIDLEKPIREGIWIGPEGKGFFQVCSYENLPAFCESCGEIGHKKQDCLEMVEDQNIEKGKEKGGSEVPLQIGMAPLQP